MARYTVNIELKKMTKEKRLALDTLMTEQGFSTTIETTGKHILFLPESTYICISKLSSVGLAQQIYTMVSVIEPHPIVFITKSIGRAWEGLNLVSIDGRKVVKK